MPNRLQKFLPYLALIAAALLAYSNVYTNQFLYDDASLFVKNDYLRDWTHLGDMFASTLMTGADVSSRYYRPLQSLLYLIIYQTFGLSLVAFHALNVGLHALNTCLVYRLGRRLNFAPMPVFLASLIWAVHPVHVEAVTYMSATADVLYAFFCLGALNLIVPYFGLRRVMAALPFFILGLLSKEAALCLPLMVMACIFLVHDKRYTIRPYFIIAPLAVLAVAYAGFHFLFPLAGWEQSDTVRKLTPPLPSQNYALFATLPAYLKLIIWPANLHMLHEFPVMPTPWHGGVVVGFALIIGTAALAMVGKSNICRVLAWGGMWFAGCHALSLGYGTILYEHWMYMPSIGLFLAVAQATYLVLQKYVMPRWMKIAGVTLCGAVAILLGFLTLQQNTTWADPITFARHIIASGHNMAKGHAMLGYEYAQNNDLVAAATEYRLAITASEDRLPEARNNLAIILQSMPDKGKYESEILENYLRAHDLDPNNFQVMEKLGRFYEERGDREKALFYQDMAKRAQAKFFGVLSP